MLSLVLKHKDGRINVHEWNAEKNNSTFPSPLTILRPLLNKGFPHNATDVSRPVPVPPLIPTTSETPEQFKVINVTNKERVRT